MPDLSPDRIAEHIETLSACVDISERLEREAQSIDTTTLMAHLHVLSEDLNLPALLAEWDSLAARGASMSKRGKCSEHGEVEGTWACPACLTVLKGAPDG